MIQFNHLVVCPTCKKEKPCSVIWMKIVTYPKKTVYRYECNCGKVFSKQY